MGGTVGRRGRSNRESRQPGDVRTTEVMGSGPLEARIVVDVGTSGDARNHTADHVDHSSWQAVNEPRLPGGEHVAER